MSDLKFSERASLEKLLGMSTGYVLDFSNRTFREFVLDSVGRNIEDEKYGYGSKANRLRTLWNKEPNHLVGALTADFLEYYRQNISEPDESLYLNCDRIMCRLKQAASVPEIEAISPNSGGRDFEVLAKSVRESIDRNEPEAALDRLHTFVVKFVRVICADRSIEFDRDEPLHSLVGKYVKHLKLRGLIESGMTERILKSSISTLDSFNRVRNEQSFAHDNPLLNHNESLLIFNHVVSAIRFIGTIECQRNESECDMDQDRLRLDDIPF